MHLEMVHGRRGSAARCPRGRRVAEPDRWPVLRTLSISSRNWSRSPGADPGPLYLILDEAMGGVYDREARAPPQSRTRRARNSMISSAPWWRFSRTANCVTVCATASDRGTRYVVVTADHRQQHGRPRDGSTSDRYAAERLPETRDGSSRSIRWMRFRDVAFDGTGRMALPA